VLLYYFKILKCEICSADDFSQSLLFVSCLKVLVGLNDNFRAIDYKLNKYIFVVPKVRIYRVVVLPYECLLFKKILPIFNICCEILSLPIQRSLNVYSFSGCFLVYQLWMMYLVLLQFFSTISR
jgi:hypothetical protein